MPTKAQVDPSKFNPAASLPFELRLKDFELSMQDVYDFVYDVDRETEPANARRPLTLSEVYLSHVSIADFRKNPRGELGTRTATLGKIGLVGFRKNWVYKL